jgi:hypothetical protein
MRIVLQEEAVYVGARIAFIRVRNYEFLRRTLLSDGAPFLASRKARATPPTQAGSIDFREDLVWSSEEGRPEHCVAPAREVFRKAPSVSLYQICENYGFRRVNFDPRALIGGKDSGSRITFSETMNRRMLRRGSLPPTGVEVSPDKAGRSLTPEIAKLSIPQMIEGIDRSLRALLTFLAIWLGGTIRIQR